MRCGIAKHAPGRQSTRGRVDPAGIHEAKGLPWLQNHLDYCTAPLLSEPWVLDMDSTVKTLYGHQEGAEIGYNPAKPGRPSHAYHTYMLSSLRLVLRVDVLPCDEYNVAHATDGLWTLLDHLGPSRRPALLRGVKSWGIERVMARAEQNNFAYLFRLRMTANVRRSLDRAMQQPDWADAGQGWKGKETSLRLQGWSRQRRVILLRRKLARELAVSDQTNPAQPLLGFAEIGPDKQLWEYAALVTSLDDEILTLGQLYRDRADSENGFDELKNQWGWGGFTTQDMERCQTSARAVALVYNWWSWYCRAAKPGARMEAITSRALLLAAVGRATKHGGQTTLYLTPMHAARKTLMLLIANIRGALRHVRTVA